jgi:hypothetical protein
MSSKKKSSRKSNKKTKDQSDDEFYEDLDEITKKKSLKKPSKESPKKSLQESPEKSPRKSPKKSSKESPRKSSKNSTRESPKKSSKESPRKSSSRTKGTSSHSQHQEESGRSTDPDKIALEAEAEHVESTDNDVVKAEETLEDPFLENVKNLIDNLKTVIVTSENARSSRAGENPILSYLNKFSYGFEGTYYKNPEGHKLNFRKLYLKHQGAILDYMDGTAWLTDKRIPIVVQFGEGVIANPNKNAQIRLSNIFLIALREYENAQKLFDVDLIQDPQANPGKYPALNYVNNILLCLYRIFVHSNLPKLDYEKINNFLLQKEKELGISRETKVESEVSMGNGGVPDLIRGVSKFAAKMGVHIPADAQMPNSANLLGMLENMTSIPGADNMMKKVQSTIKDFENKPEEDKNPKDLLGNMLGLLGDPATEEAVASTMSSAAGTSSKNGNSDNNSGPSNNGPEEASNNSSPTVDHSVTPNGGTSPMVSSGISREPSAKPSTAAPSKPTSSISGKNPSGVAPKGSNSSNSSNSPNSSGAPKKPVSKIGYVDDAPQ